MSMKNGVEMCALDKINEYFCWGEENWKLQMEKRKTPNPKRGPYFIPHICT